MLGKNNYNERLSKMEMQSKQDRFSIRKLSIGAASVLLGFIFLGLNVHTVKADTVGTDPHISEAAFTSSNAKGKKNISKNKVEIAEGPDLATYSGLTLFLKTDNNVQKQVSDDKTSVSKDNDKTGSDSEINDHSATNSGNTDNNSDNSNSETKEPINNTDSKKPENESEKLPNESTSKSKTNHSDKLIKAERDSDLPEIKDGTVQVTNWKQFIAALTNKNYFEATNPDENEKISEIDVMNDICASKTGTEDSIYFSGRKLLIKSGDGGKHIIDFKGSHPKTDGNSKENLDLTYQNLTLWSADWYGVVDTQDYNYGSKITFEDVDFHGTQMIFTGSKTSVYFTGKNTAETVNLPYNSPVDGEETNQANRNQQLFEFTGNGCSITFDGDFTGSTYSGQVVEANSSDDKVTINKNAVVTLIPCRNADKEAPTPDHGDGAAYAILCTGDNDVIDVNGTLNIVIGDIGNFTSSNCDYRQAKAIKLGQNSCEFNINEGAAVNIKTNGDISNYVNNYLINDNGDFNIKSNGKLRIDAQNMANYSGTLVKISRNANIENGAFEIVLHDDPNHPYNSENPDDSAIYGAGKNDITLIDVSGGTLILNNPTSLILDAHLNKAKRTSIIGNNGITITNARQILDLGQMSDTSLTLPPFHIFKIDKRSSNNVTVDQLELLNGKKSLTKKDVDNLKKNETVISLLNKLPESMKQYISDTIEAAVNKGTNFDELFSQIITDALSQSDNPIYNNISFIPANPSGFLDIANINVISNDDGSRTVEGKLLNYSPEKDGPSSDGIFNSALQDGPLPGGTDAYVLANILDAGKKTEWKDDKISNPYVNTLNENSELPTHFAAKVDANGEFRFTIPATTTVSLTKDAKIELIPHANFIGYDPFKPAKEPVSLNIRTLSDVQNDAAELINNEIKKAKNKKPANLTEKESSAFDDALNSIANSYTKTANEDGYDKDKSVFGAEDIAAVNKRKNDAIYLIQEAVKNAESQSDFDTKKAEAINKLKQEAEEQSKAFSSLKDDINAAEEKAEAGVNDSTTENELAQKVNDGIGNIDKVVKGYKDNIKSEINKEIGQVETDIDSIAKDANLSSTEKHNIHEEFKNALEKPKDIAKENGTIDQDSAESEVSGHEQTANNDIDAIKNKIKAIETVEQEAKEQIVKHSEDAEDIKDALNHAVENILNGNDKNGDRGKDAIDKVHDGNIKKIAETEIKQAAEAARAKIQNSGLSKDEQQKYLNRVNEDETAALAKKDDANFDAAKSIYGSELDDEIKNRQTKVQNLFSKEAAKAEIDGYAKQVENSIPDMTIDEIENIGSVKDQYIDNIDKIKDTGVIDSEISQTLGDAKVKILESLKNVANARLENKEKAVVQDINDTMGLTADEKAQAVHDAEDLLSNDKKAGYSDLIDSSKTAKEINEHLNDGLKALAQLAVEIADNELKKQRLAAKDEINKKAEEARKQIETIPDNEISPANKADYEKQIAEAQTEAINSIDAAQNKDGIATAQNKGNLAIDKVLTDAIIEQTKSKALNEIKQHRDDDLNRVKTAHDNKLINDQQWQEAVDSINNSCNSAIINISRNKTISDINISKQDGIDAMDAVADGIEGDQEAQKLAKAKQDAINSLNGLADEIKDKINNDESLSSLEKDGFKGRVDSVLNEAKTKINAAAIPAEIDQLKNTYSDQIKGIDSAADVQAAKEKGLQDLQDAKNIALEQIDKLANIDNDAKNELRNQINDAYDKAEKQIKNPTPETVETVSANAAEGITNINKVLTDVNVAKVINQRKLNKYAENALNDVKKNKDIDEKDKQKSLADIAEALNTGLSNIEKADSVESVRNAEGAAEGTIDQAAAVGIGLETIKKQASDQLDNTALKAKKDLKTAFDKLSADYQKLADNENTTLKADYEKAKAAYDEAIKDGGLIDQVCQKAKSAIQSAKDKETVDAILSDGISGILAQESTSSLAIIKAQAKINIQNKIDQAKEQLSDQNTNQLNASDKKALDAVQKLGNSDIDAEKDAATVAVIEKNTVNQINNIVTNAKAENADQIRTARDKAIAELDKILKGNMNEGQSGVLNQIAALQDEAGKKGLTPDQVAKFAEQAQAAYDKAVGAISGATADQIESLKQEGISNINEALTDAQLQAAKNKAMSQLDDAAEKAKTQVKDPKDKENIDQDLNVAKDKVDQAENEDEINQAIQDGEVAINGIVDTISNAALTDEKAAAKNELADSARQLKADIDQAFNDKKIDSNQQAELKQKVKVAIETANANIDSVDDLDPDKAEFNINKAKIAGQNDLAKVKTDLNQNIALNKALQDLDTAANQAKDTADKVAQEIAETPEEQKKLDSDMKEQIEAERQEGVANILKAKDSQADSNTAISNAAKQSIEAINNLTNRFKDKSSQISKLKDYAKKAKEDLNNKDTHHLDPTEIAQGERDIDSALQKGISKIYQADSSTDLVKTEFESEKAIDAAKLPCELLSEKNAQIAKINEYAKKAAEAINKHLLSEDNPAGLSSEVIKNLQDQVEAAKQKAIEKINGVVLSESTADSLNEAKQAIDNAEQGIGGKDEPDDFGESAINNIVKIAEQKADIVKIKQDEIAKLVKQKDEAIQNIEGSDLSVDEQKSQKDKINNIFNQGKESINGIPDKDSDGNDRTSAEVMQDAENIVNHSIKDFNQATTDAKLASAKSKAKMTLNDKMVQAHNIINASQLSNKEKATANKEIDNAFESANKEIDKLTDSAKIPQDLGKEIDAILHNGNQPIDWCEKDQSNALNGEEKISGLQAALNKLTDKQKNNPDYQEYIKTIQESIEAIRSADNIKDVTSAYNKGMNCLMKLKAKDQISEAHSKAEEEIKSNPDLDESQKEELINSANKHAKNGNAKIDGVNAPASDLGSQEKQIDKIVNDTTEDIQTDVNKANSISKSNANEEIAKEHENAVDKIHQEFGADADTEAIDNAFEHHKQVSGSTSAEIAKDKIQAEKEIAKGAIASEAANAKNKVDNGEVKHHDGTDLTDKEKDSIKNQIDQNSKNSKDKIDNSENTETIDQARDEGITNIHNDTSNQETIDNIISGSNSNNSNPVVPAQVPEANKEKKPAVNDNNDGPKPGNIGSFDPSKGEKAVLMHNAYVYDINGVRANKIIIGAGSIVITYGVKNIKGRDFYILIDQGADNRKYFIAVNNIKSVAKKLKHNAYVYNKHGNRIKKAGVLKKGQTIHTYGSAVKIRGKKYFIIAKNRYIKVANVVTDQISVKEANELVRVHKKTEQPMAVEEKTIMHNSYLYNKKGIRANKVIILAGSSINTTGLKIINGKAYYVLGDGLFIDARNIDGLALKLNHNAYIYSRHGNRLGKKVLKKHKLVRTFGDTIKINHKKYYIIAKGKHVKKANFI